MLLMVFRLRYGWRFAFPPAGRFFVWLFASREYTNFTYDLEAVNKQYLNAFLADVTGVDFETAKGFVEELEGDDGLRQHLRTGIAQSEHGSFADPDMKYGRRLGWYAFVRILKPKVVVETGVDKGLGACILAAALARNRDEGFEGRYFGTDINPAAGYLFSGEYAQYGEILYGDSIESLEALDEKIDLFINDSDHSIDYEAREYQTVRRRLGDEALVISDNAHQADALLKFARQTGRSFAFFKEEPHKHWYPGGGIGAAFRRKS